MACLNVFTEPVKQYSVPSLENTFFNNQTCTVNDCENACGNFWNNNTQQFNECISSCAEAYTSYNTFSPQDKQLYPLLLNNLVNNNATTQNALNGFIASNGCDTFQGQANSICQTIENLSRQDLTACTNAIAYAIAKCTSAVAAPSSNSMAWPNIIVLIIAIIVIFLMTMFTRK